MENSPARTRTSSLADSYRRDGYVTGVDVLAPDQVLHHRRLLETAEAQLGSLHYRDNIHTLLPSPLHLATIPAVLDIVEQLIGPDILLYNSTFIIKEPQTEAFVSWHQDLTYWGLSDDDAQVSMWLALAPATEASGCMSMIPQSHRGGRSAHVEVTGDDNLLLLGQRLVEVDSTLAVTCRLEPGQASFHHGWTVHASGPNSTGDRRIGLNVQYLAPHNSFTGAAVAASATLVRGVDRHGNFAAEESPLASLTDRAIARWTARDEAMKQSFKTGGD